MRKLSLVFALLLFGRTLAAAENSSVTSDLQAQALNAFKAGDYKKSANLYRTLAAENPNDAQILRDFMWACWNAGNPQETIAAGKKILAIEPSDVETLNLVGKAYQASGDRKSALQSFKRVADAHPNSVSAKVSLIRSQIELADLASAERTLQALDSDIPSKGALREKIDGLWKALARAYSESGRSEKAIAIYQKIMRVSASNTQVQIAYARLQTDQKKYDEAERVLKRILVTSPDALPVYPKLAAVQFLKKDFASSVDNWNAAIRSFPDKVEYKYKRGLALYFNKNFDEALQQMVNLLADPEWGRKAADFLYDDAFAQGENTKAAKYLADSLETLEYTPEDQQRYIRLSNAYERQNDYKKAEQALDAALDHFPDDGAVRWSMASLYLETNRLGKAVPFMKDILQRNPNASHIIYALVDSQVTLGNRADALRILQSERRVDPTNPFLMLREAELLYLTDQREKARAMLTAWLQEKGDGPVLPVALYHGLTPYDRDGMLAHQQHHRASVFDEHMRALHDAGYTPVTVPEAFRWVKGEFELPKKAILISFDDGRLDSFQNADPILKKYDMKATMFVIGQNADRNLPNYANWKELREYQKTGRWNFEAHTDHGHSYIPITKEGHKGLFLLNKKWLESEGRLETRQEWIDRIDADHDRIKRKMLTELKVNVEGFAFPEGNYGHIYIPNAKESADVNMSAARNYFDLSFFQESEGLGINVRSRDPAMLNRFEPSPDWTGSDLLRRISDNIPANKMRATLLHWAIWEGRLNEANAWLNELRKGGASPALLLSEHARIYASHGNLVKARGLGKDADTAKGNRSIANDDNEQIVRDASRPEYSAYGRMFEDKVHRRNKLLEQSFMFPAFGDFRFTLLQRLGNYAERNVPHVSENAWGARVGVPLGLRHNISVEGMQSVFNAHVDNQTSGQAAFRSHWSDRFTTEVNAARQPLFFAQALSQNIRLRTLRLGGSYRERDDWEFGGEARASHYSDTNDRFDGQFNAAMGLGARKRTRLMYVLSGMTNDQTSPFYYSPEHLFENSIGLSQIVPFHGAYKLTLTYLPGYGQESDVSSHFIQNFKVGLVCHWTDATSLDLDFQYQETPSYYSRSANARFVHRFGLKRLSAEAATSIQRSPEELQTQND